MQYTEEQLAVRPQQVWCSECGTWHKFERVIKTFTCPKGIKFKAKVHPKLIKNDPTNNDKNTAGGGKRKKV